MTMNTPAKIDASGFRWATTSYIAALTFIALLIVGTHLLNDAILQRQQGSAQVINLAGRQRMLSQRIAMLALELPPAPVERRQALGIELASNLEELERAHAALNHGAVEIGIPAAMSMEAKGIHAHDRERLNSGMTEFISQGRSYLALSDKEREASPQLAYLLKAAQAPLLEKLETIVAQLQAESEQSITNLRRTMFATLAVMLITLAVEALFIFRPLFRSLKAAQLALLEAAMTDPMTGCMNRRCWMATARKELKRSRRHGQPLALMVLDIDHFKSINDTWGHAVGDAAIITFARTLRGLLRSADALGRLGGDEFVVLLPETDARQAMLVAEKLRVRVSETVVETSSHNFNMTISIGVTKLAAADDDITATLDRADQALYQAKQSGRNRAHFLSLEG